MAITGDLRERFRRLAKTQLVADSTDEARASAYTCFNRLPASAVTVSTDQDFIVIGTASPTIARSATGNRSGVNLGTSGALNSNVILIPAAVGTGMYTTTTTSDTNIFFYTRLALPSIAAIAVSAGITSGVASVVPESTDGVAFYFDPNSAITMAGISASAHANNWIAGVRNTSVDSFFDTGVPVVAATDYKLAIFMGPDRVARFYINGLQFAISAANTAGVILGAKIGVLSTTAVAKSVDLRFVKLTHAIAG